MKLIKKYQYGKPIERQDNTSTNNRPPKRDINRELYYYYMGLINRALPKTYEEFKLDLINIGVLPDEGDYSVPIGHLGDGYHSVVVSPEVKYGPYDLPEMNVEGWGITQDPKYSDEEWKNLAEKTILNDTTLSLGDAVKYMWALNHPEFRVNPFLRSGSIPVQPGPWNRELITQVDYEGYLPSDNPKYGGSGEITYDYSPSRVQTYQTRKYPPEDFNNKERLYRWLDRFYNIKNRLYKRTKE